LFPDANIAIVGAFYFDLSGDKAGAENRVTRRLTGDTYSYFSDTVAVNGLRGINDTVRIDILRQVQGLIAIRVIRFCPEFTALAQ
jgi:hypothetical protein